MAITADQVIRNPDFNRAHSLFDFTIKKLTGEIFKLDAYTGLVCILVNVASKSAFTAGNYKLLNGLYDKYYDRGLRILAFPCNQFNNEEPGSAEEILAFMQENGVKFDVFEKVNVNGEEASPVWKYLKLNVSLGTGKGSVIKTNFTKFIVGKAGAPQQRFGPEADYADLIKAIESYL